MREWWTGRMRSLTARLSRIHTKRLRGKKNVLLFCTALFLWGCLVASTYAYTQRSLDSTGWISHTYNVLFSLETLQSQSEQAESCMSEYALFQDQSRLICYHDTLEAIPRQMGQLSQLISGNLVQEKNFDHFQPIVRATLDILQEGDLLQTLHGFQPDEQVLLTRRFAASHVQMRMLIVDMEKREQEVLAEHLIERQKATLRTTLMLGSGALFSVVILSLVFLKLNREIEKRVDAQHYMRLAYAALELGNRHLIGVLESTPDSIAAVDLQLNWIAFNRNYNVAFRNRYKCNPETGTSLEGILADHPTELSEAAALWLRALSGETFAVTEESTDEVGCRKIHEIRYYPITDRGGTPIAACQIARDITERRQFENILFHQSEELKRSNAELEQFAYVASHDLQEPLRMVSSYMQLLAERYQGKLDAKADKYIEYAVDGAQRMQALINDLLMVSRVNSRGGKLKSVNCADLIQSVLHDLQTEIHASGAVVDHEPLPTVRADERQLAQVFQNLIGNALKFRAVHSPRIRIRAQQKQEQWLFTVQDNGIGIAPEHFEQIFVMFQRLHSREQYGGTGIGLAVCKKIVERHGGQIWVTSEPGHGATFNFTLPLVRSTTACSNHPEAITCA